MVAITALLPVMVLFSPAASSSNERCEVPTHVSKAQKVPCVRASTVLGDQPSLTLEQLQKGPDFDASDPVRSRFAYFTPDSSFNCYFRPFFAYIPGRGKSPKFLCWHLDDDDLLFDRSGQRIDVPDVKVVAGADAGRSHSALYAAGDTARTHALEADVVKVKYLNPPFPNHSPRDNEVFTEVAASRIMWALGFPADRQYSALAVKCIGCSTDPFKDNQKENRASMHDKPVVFNVVSVERLLGWDAIAADNDETWSWSDAATFYAHGWTHDQKVGFDAYRLALALLTYHNPMDAQNRLVCAAWEPGAGDPKVCDRPVIFVQDLGSTFGKPGAFGMNPRGDFSDWQSQHVFANAAQCQLTHPLRNDPTILADARTLLLRRLDNLGRDRVKAIFEASRFQMMDQKQLERLRRSGVTDVADAALNEWTDVFMRHVEEVRSARNCRP